MRIALVGRKGSGKNEVAFVLKHERGYEQLALADPMKAVAKMIFDWSDKDIEAHKEEVDPRYGISPREFLQVFGTDFAQHMLSQMFPEYKRTTGRLLWVRHLIDRLRWMGVGPASKIVVTDVRFPHEAEVLKREGFMLVRVVRSEYEDRHDSHESEQCVDLIQEDVRLMNQGTLEDLYSRVLDWIDKEDQE